MKYTVNTIAEAWKKANEIFPTDYELNDCYSHNAGYPVYTSTGFGVNAWISDLGNRLEVNLPDGTSINIWIEGNDEELEAERKDATIKAQAEEIAELKAQVAEMAKQIERLEGWTAYEDKHNVSQKDYDHLRQSGRVMSDDEAKELIADEFGFAPAKIQIIHEVNTYEINRMQRLRKAGTTERLPLYDATDWNYIRFNVSGWMYEMYNGALNQFID